MRILKSMPIVVMKEGVKESSLKRRRQQDFPTPESPIRRSLIYAIANRCQNGPDQHKGEIDVLGNHNSWWSP